MRDQHSSDSNAFPSCEPFPLLQVRAGTLVVDGFGVRLFVRDGKLHVEDGIGPHRRSAILGRHCGARTLLLLARSGSLTLDALEWLRNIGCSLIHINHSNDIIASTIPHSIAGIRRRRKQVTATLTGLDVELSRFVLTRKFDGQARNLQGRLNANQTIVDSFNVQRQRLMQAPSIEELRQIEARASAAYWRAWSPSQIKFGPPRDLNRIPSSWLCFDGRSSIISGLPRAATSIPNALINYVGALARSQCHLAMISYGLDPMLGWLHQDHDHRPSATLDVQELVREHIEARVLDLLASRRFTRKDFIELPNGACWVQPPFTHELAHEIPLWRSLALDAVASVGKFIDGWADKSIKETRAPKSRVRVADTKPWTPPLRPRPHIVHKGTAPKPYADRTNWLPRAPQQLRIPVPCVRCSAPIHTRRRRHCDDCMSSMRLEIGRRNSKLGRQSLAALPRSVDPRFSTAAQAARSRNISVAHRANRGWDKTAVDWGHYKSAILPALNQQTLQKIADALSVSTLNSLARGQKLFRWVDAKCSEVFVAEADATETDSSFLGVRLRLEGDAWIPCGEPARVERRDIFHPPLLASMQRWRFLRPVDPLIDVIATPVGSQIDLWQDAILTIGDAGVPVRAHLQVVDHRVSIETDVHYNLAGLVCDVDTEHLVNETIQPAEASGLDWRADVAVDGASMRANEEGYTAKVNLKMAHVQMVHLVGETVATREVFIGANIGAWTHSIYRREPPIHPLYLQYGLPPDSIRLKLFDRPTIVYEPPQHDKTDAGYLAVLYMGSPLDEPQHSVLAALIGYLSGGRAVTVLQETFDVERKLGASYLYRGEPTVRRSPPIPVENPTPYASLMVEQIPQLAAAFERWRSVDARAFEAVFHHYAEGVDSNYPTTRILRLSVALEAFVNLVTGDTASNESIIPNERFTPLQKHLQRSLEEYRDNDGTLDASELLRFSRKIENLNVASNTRRIAAFWQTIPLVKDPADDALLRKLRSDSVHRGYVGAETTREGLLRNAADADRLTDLFNRALLAYAGYTGPVRSAKNGKWIQALSGEAFQLPALPPSNTIELRIDHTVPPMAEAERSAAEALGRMSRSVKRNESR